IRKRVSRHLDPHPETVRADKHAPWRRLELFQQSAARQTRPLDQQIHLSVDEKFFHASGDLLHTPVAGKQDERAAGSLLDKMTDPLDQRFVCASVAWIGHFLHDEQLHLFLKIKWAAELKRAGAGRSNALPEIDQVGTANCECRAGHHTRARITK